MEIPLPRIVSESKIKLKFENFKFDSKEYRKEQNIEELSTYGNLKFTCLIRQAEVQVLTKVMVQLGAPVPITPVSSILTPVMLKPLTPFLIVDIKGFKEAIWKSGKYELQVIATVPGITTKPLLPSLLQDLVIADSGLKKADKQDFLRILSKYLNRSAVNVCRLQSDGSLVLVITVKIYGPDPQLNHNCEIVKLTSKILDSGSYSDFTVIVQKQEFKVHRCVLAAASPVFDLMFSIDMTESKSGRHVVGENIKPPIFKHLLEFIYVDKVPVNISEVALELFEAAHYYGIEKLEKICAEELIANLKTENSLETYKFASTYELKELKLEAWKIIKRDIIKDLTLEDNEMPQVEIILKIADHKRKIQELCDEVKRAQSAGKEPGNSKKLKLMLD